MGNEGDQMDSADLIGHVRAQTDVGKSIIDSQLFFIRSLQDLPIDENVLANN